MADRVAQHFRAEEAPFIESATGWIQQASDEYRPILTHFLNPRQQYILSTLVNRDSELKLAFNGGYETAEMKRAMIFPDYIDQKELDFELTLFEIDYPTKFTELEHGSIMGTVLGAGVDRDVLGDIITDGSRWQFYITADMSRYIATQIDHVGRIKVRLIQMDLDAHIEPLNAWEEESTTLSSTRLDNVVATGFHLSRHHAKELIEAGKIQLNWNDFGRPDYQLEHQDVISVRGFGRVRLTSVNGVTKKDKLRVTLAVLHK
ncbi:RNA-binding protein [Secundilactobacillus folii]|uniref:RNA-binding protein n=1 Tax=Secundilactobacillus folii TaxID=2678357 RepID=A0A7X2XWE1_9LACO|nr:RNA-binding protein [Secundilactobacillus folii]MTV82909.1 RNA-binding protein [Secundilactobacillus folii]